VYTLKFDMEAREIEKETNILESAAAQVAGNITEFNGTRSLEMPVWLAIESGYLEEGANFTNPNATIIVTLPAPKDVPEVYASQFSRWLGVSMGGLVQDGALNRPLLIGTKIAMIVFIPAFGSLMAEVAEYTG
jgi:hypothetical protein